MAKREGVSLPIKENNWLWINLERNDEFVIGKPKQQQTKALQNITESNKGRGTRRKKVLVPK